ncbi:hypothetical protein F66182_7828 [Fusarium sp. NRRL 66182]|nr:hypothetical protein F66182_7828 [Fusarium sp. NRRL 66182]
MPGPPTPVSSCSLSYLEIRDGVSARACNTLQPHSVFTLTIEGERLIDAETGILILLIRHGRQQVVSLRLNKIGGQSQAPEDVVTINTKAKRMCVRVPSKSQAILVQFEEKRDFSVAICLLQKAGFYISDAIPTSLLSTPLSTQTGVPHSTLDLGPRLSTIAPVPPLPLNHAQGSQSQSCFSFTEMLSAPSPYAPVSSAPTPQIPYTQRTHSLPTHYSPTANHIPETVPFETHLNPHNMFLGRGRLSATKLLTDYSNIQFGSPDMVQEHGDQISGLKLVHKSTRKSNQDIHRDAECQTNVIRSPNNLDSSSGVSSLKMKISGAPTSSQALVIDYETLKELDQVTATIFKQYEADVANSCDEKLYADFYMDQLWKKRRDFWLAKLQTVDSITT